MTTTLPTQSTLPTESTQALQDTMNGLETALLSPVLSGELKDWLHAVEQAAQTFATDWTRHLHSTAHVEYREIARTDAEMLPVVDKMIAADQQLLQDLAQFHDELHGLSKQAEEVGWHEDQLKSHQKHIETSGIQLLTRFKKQQLAAATWLSEAFYRDRGNKD